MIQILNSEYFTFKYDDESIKGAKAIHVFTEPQDIDIDLYSKKSFATILGEKFDGFFTTDQREMRKHKSSIILQRDSGNGIYLPYKQEATQIHSSSSMKINPAAVYFTAKDARFKNDTAIVIAGIPLRGIIQPIPRSENYKLYNGYILKTHPFQNVFTEYRKILYLTFELKSTLTFTEYIYPSQVAHDNLIKAAFPNSTFSDDMKEYGTCITHTIGLTHDGNTLFNNLTGRSKTEESGWDIDDDKSTSYIPYEINKECFRSDESRKLFYITSNIRKVHNTDTNDNKPINIDNAKSSGISPMGI